MKKLIVFLLFNLSIVSSGVGQGIVGWTGLGDGVNWSDVDNWEDGNTFAPRLPTATDLVIISPVAASAVVLDIDASIQMLVINVDCSLDIPSSTLTIDNLNCNDPFYPGCGIGIALDEGTLTVGTGGKVNITNTEEEGIEVGYNGVLENKGIITITNSNVEGIELESDMASIVNDGTITIQNCGEEGIEVDDDTAIFTNNGMLNISNIGNEEAIDIDHDGAMFINNGEVNISDIQDAEALDITGTFSNNGLLNIENSVANTDNILQIKNPTGSLTNSLCGVVNIKSNHIIQIFSNGSLTNDGIITASHNLVHDNEGTFTNNKALAAPASNFTAAPNVIAGGGAKLSSPIPAQARHFCPPPAPVPSLSQWGIVILGLFMAVIGIVGLTQKAIVKAKA